MKTPILQGHSDLRRLLVPPEEIYEHISKRRSPASAELVPLVSCARNDQQKAKPLPTGYLTSSWQQHPWQFRDKWDSSAVSQSSTGSLKENLLGFLFPLGTPMLFPSFFSELSFVWISLDYKGKNKTTTLLKNSYSPFITADKKNSTSTKTILHEYLLSISR